MVDVQCNDKQMAELIASLQSEVAAVKLAEFDMGVDPPMSPAISESFGKFPFSSSVQIIIIQKNTNFKFWKNLIINPNYKVFFLMVRR